MKEADRRILRDPARLTALERTCLLDSPVDEAFDRVTRLTMRVLNVPASMVSLVDGRRQFFKSCMGVPEPWASMRETPLSHSFCQHVVVAGRPLLIEDARSHPLVRDNPAVRDLGAVAYAGYPLKTDDGHVLGTLCAMDTKPRQWSDEDRMTLGDLSAFVMAEIRLRERLSPDEEGTRPVVETAPPPSPVVSDDASQELIKTITERIRQQPHVEIRVGHLYCPRCRGTRRVEQLTSGPESQWFRCYVCGHVWE